MTTPVRRAPPRPPPRPGQVKVMRALYTYVAQQPDELSFEEDDLLFILDMTTDPNWWKAKCGNKVGVIPRTYVENEDNIKEVLHPLHEAARRGTLHLLKEYLLNGVCVNALDKAGCTALHWAAHAGYIECVNELLKVPIVEVNLQNKIGDTPLHFAAWKGRSDVVKALLNHSADPNIKNNEGKTPFDLANDPSTLSVLQSFSEQYCNVGAKYEDYEDSDDD